MARSLRDFDSIRQTLLGRQLVVAQSYQYGRENTTAPIPGHK